MMEKRLIDAINLEAYLIINAADEWNKTVAPASWSEAYLELVDDLDAMPTIDAVELPCKIGDTVWIARRYKCHKRPRWGIVSEMFFTEDMELCIVVKGVARGKWGVDVFATYEEAEAQIERNNRKEQQT